MSGIIGVEGAALAAICITSAVLAVVWLTSAGRTGTSAPQHPAVASDNQTSFLFDRQTLTDATRSALGLLESTEGETDWERVTALLRPRFAEFPGLIDKTQETGTLIIPSLASDDAGTLQVEWWENIIRIELIEHEKTTPCAADQHRLRTLQKELETLRQAMGGAPYPVWQTNGEGAVTWNNAAYAALRDRIPSCPDTHPDASLFDVGETERFAAGKARCSLSIPDTDQLYWFDISMVRFGREQVFYAVDINAVVNAEIAQRNFVQTLAKTFAQLSTGLAIFDRNRQLALFNPALVDLTALPADFLSARPNLLSFFDRLRDNQMMPEPKNYTTWRDQIADLVAAAADGRYFETWPLPSGPTYRVNGRPHPDGAIAFLFEDISAEVSLTRRFRSELELGQSLLDAIEDAIAVFSSTGLLTMSNTAYRDLWGIDPDSSFVDMTVLDAIRHWQKNCDAAPILGEIRDYVLEYAERSEWDAPVRTKTGIDLLCKVHPVTGGATLVRFRKSVDRPASTAGDETKGETTAARA